MRTRNVDKFPKIVFYQKHGQNVENEVEGGGRVREPGKALSGKTAWCTGLCIKPTIYNLVSGRDCFPCSSFRDYLLEHSSLGRWRPCVLIFLECWIFFPQQIYFANGFWLWLAFLQKHSLYCGYHSVIITVGE